MNTWWPRLLGLPAREWILRAPTERGKARMMRWLARLPHEAADFRAQAPGGGHVWARMTESTGLALARGEDIEGAEIEYALSVLEHGSTIVDAGANVGLFTVPVAQALGARGRIIAVEPIPATCRRLQRSISLNRFTNVTVYNVALSSTEGSCDFYVAADSAYSGFAPDSRSPPIATIGVTHRPLDDIWEEEGSPLITFIKLDVEGAEVEALRGATRVLGTCRPTLLLEANGDEAFAAARSFLSEQGYAATQSPAGFRPYNHVFVTVRQ